MMSDPLTLALEVIAKYGPEADKPSVHLAKALITQHEALNEALDMVERAVHTYVVPGPHTEGSAAFTRAAFMRRADELRRLHGVPRLP